MKKLALLPVAAVSLFYLWQIVAWHLPVAYGQIATSSSYALNEGDFVVSSFEDAQSENFQAQITQSSNLFHNPYGAFANSGFFSGTGVIDPLTFTGLFIQDTQVNFNSLTPGIFTAATSNLDVLTNNPTGYTLFASESFPLTISNGMDHIINDTTCNAEPTASCSATTAQPWTDPNIAGFGFNVQGSDITPDFVDATYFRPFVNLDQESTPSAVPIAYRDTVTDSGQTYTTQVTYQASVPGDQVAGTYHNYIFYTALPNL